MCMCCASGVASIYTCQDRLRSDAQQKPAQTQPVTKPHMVKRSTVRLRERERALAELRDKFYDSTTIDDSVLDFPHGPKSERFEANIPEPLAVSTSAPLEAPQASYPAYFNTAVARKKAASKVPRDLFLLTWVPPTHPNFRNIRWSPVTTRALQGPCPQWSRRKKRCT